MFGNRVKRGAAVSVSPPVGNIFSIYYKNVHLFAKIKEFFQFLYILVSVFNGSNNVIFETRCTYSMYCVLYYTHARSPRLNVNKTHISAVNRRLTLLLLYDRERLCCLWLLIRCYMPVVLRRVSCDFCNGIRNQKVFIQPNQ